jgi:hypothetical protein
MFVFKWEQPVICALSLSVLDDTFLETYWRRVVCRGEVTSSAVYDRQLLRHVFEAGSLKQGCLFIALFLVELHVMRVV